LTRFTPRKQRYIIISHPLLKAVSCEDPVVTEPCVLLPIFGTFVVLVRTIERLLRGRWRYA